MSLVTHVYTYQDTILVNSDRFIAFLGCNRDVLLSHRFEESNFFVAFLQSTHNGQGCGSLPDVLSGCCYKDGTLFPSGIGHGTPKSTAVRKLIPSERVVVGGNTERPPAIVIVVVVVVVAFPAAVASNTGASTPLGGGEGSILVLRTTNEVAQSGRRRDHNGSGSSPAFYPNRCPTLYANRSVKERCRHG